jgi:hypothetical protein
MSWLKAILLVLQAVNTVVAWLRERQTLTAGEAQAIAEALKVTNAHVEKALAARRAAAAGGMSDDDPYLRD